MNTIEAEFVHRHIDKKVDMDYFKDLIHGVIKYQKTIDGEIQPDAR